MIDFPEWMKTPECQRYIEVQGEIARAETEKYTKGREMKLHHGSNEHGWKYIYLVFEGIEFEGQDKRNDELMKRGWGSGISYPPPEHGQPRPGIPYIQKCLTYERGKEISGRTNKLEPQQRPAKSKPWTPVRGVRGIRK